MMPQLCSIFRGQELVAADLECVLEEPPWLPPHASDREDRERRRVGTFWAPIEVGERVVRIEGSLTVVLNDGRSIHIEELRRKVFDTPQHVGYVFHGLEGEDENRNQRSDA